MVVVATRLSTGDGAELPVVGADGGVLNVDKLAPVLTVTAEVIVVAAVGGSAAQVQTAPQDGLNLGKKLMMPL